MMYISFFYFFIFCKLDHIGQLLIVFFYFQAAIVVINRSRNQAEQIKICKLSSKKHYQISGLE